MIRLKQLDPSRIAEHATALRDDTLKKLAKQFAKLPASAQSSESMDLKIYLETNIDSLLTGTPRQLKKHIKHFQKNFDWFHQYAKGSHSASSPKHDAAIHPVIAAVRKAFDYDGFSDRRVNWCAYRLVKLHDLRLCPYCNLNHVNFHGGSKRTIKGVKTFSMRPPLDHYYPRSAYPYLGISIYNLIPSCHQCNSSIKLQDDPMQRSLPHPFYFPKNSIKFSVDDLSDYNRPVPANKIKIKIESKKAAAIKHADFFELATRYGWYANEVEDVHLRYLQYVKSDPALAVPLDNYILLGYRNAEGERRSLGLCLDDIVTQWITYIST